MNYLILSIDPQLFSFFKLHTTFLNSPMMCNVHHRVIVLCTFRDILVPNISNFQVVFRNSTRQSKSLTQKSVTFSNFRQQIYKKRYFIHISTALWSAKLAFLFVFCVSLETISSINTTGSISFSYLSLVLAAKNPS